MPILHKYMPGDILYKSKNETYNNCETSDSDHTYANYETLNMHDTSDSVKNLTMNK